MIVYERKAYYHETDQMGVIHHSNYFRWLEEARVYFLDQLGLSYKHMEEIGIISPVVSIAAEYKKPVKFDEVVLIYIKIAKYTGVKLELEYEIRDKETNELMVSANSKHCFVKNESVISLKREYPDFNDIFLNYLENQDK
jgi:acyl-CoA thioester hydrolase